MQIICKEEQIEQKLLFLVGKRKLSKYEEKVLDFLELAQSSTEIQDVLSFSYLNISTLGNGKYELRYADNASLIFETDDTAITVLMV
ncbi:MAG: hypothetical protein K6B43_03065 [Treponema sp.]|nr:hypothetical protein [Treponema sp.]